MTDAISRSAVLESAELISWYHANQKGKMVSGASSSDEAYAKFNDVVSLLENATTLDVAPVVHAYWIGLEYDGYADGFPVFDTWQCSACGEEFYSEGEPPAYNFCTHCGARMDGESDA